MKVLIVAAFVVIFAALAAAGVFMMRGRSSSDGRTRSRNMAWALTVRIGVSVALFLAILLSWKLGWIHPTGIAAGA